jgi:hypothetical protein
MTFNRKRDELIDRAITAVGVAPSLRKRAAENLAKLSNDEIVEHIECADNLRLRAQLFLDGRAL